MPIALLMPALSPTMTEGNIAKWLKGVGDNIVSGDIIAEVETDKATMEVEAIDEGKLASILYPDGSENVAVNQLIGVIALEEDTEEDIKKFIETNKKLTSKSIITSKEGDNKVDNTSREDDINKEDNILKQEEPVKENDITNKNENLVIDNNDYDVKKNSPEIEKKILISPLAKRIAEIKSIDLSRITGSGPKGRIVKKDLDSYLDINVDKQETSNSYKNNKKEIKLTNIRKTIAKRLQESKSTIPHFYLKGKVEVEELFKERIKINEFFAHEKIKVSFNDFFIKAMAMALKKVPEMNSIWNGDSIIQFEQVDICVAVASEKGLFTPIIRSACSKSLSIISNEIKALAIKAKEGKLAPIEYTGGSFSISNLGMYEIIDFSAIINPPQSGIIAIGSIIEEPTVKNNEIKIVKTVSYTLSVDHRIADGAVAAKLLKYFNFYINNPTSMLV